MKTRIHLSDIENIVLESVNLGAIHNSQPRQLDVRVFALNGHCYVWSFKEMRVWNDYVEDDDKSSSDHGVVCTRFIHDTAEK